MGQWTARGAIAIPAAFLGAALIFRALLLHAPERLATDLRQPLIVATSWHAFGTLFWCVAACAVGVAAIAYVRLLLAYLRDERAPGLVSLGGLTAVSTVCALALPVIFSSDVYAYAAYGWMDAHGISPYAHATIATHDPLMTAAIWQWSNPLPVCVYGPLFVWIAKLCVLAGSAGGPALALWYLRGISSLALVACVPLAYAAFSWLPRNRRLLAAAGIALNPVIIWIAAEGHNDTLVLATVLTGFIVARRAGGFAGAFIVAAAALIKASSLAAAAVFALYALRDGARFVRIAAGTVCGILVTVAIARPFEAGVSTVLVPHGHYQPQFSVQSGVVQLLQGALGAPFALNAGIALTLVAACGVALYGVRRALQRDLEGAAFLALALWMAIPNPYPWYALWILPVAFLSVRKPAAWAIVAASLTIFLRYLPDVSSSASGDVNLLVTMGEFGLPIALLARSAGAWAAARAAATDS